MFTTLHRPLPWKSAEAAIRLPPHQEQRAHLTVHTRVSVTFRIPLEIKFLHKETPAGWELTSTTVLPSEKFGSASARTAAAALEPLVRELLSDPALRADIRPLHEEVLHWQAAAALQALRRSRTAVAQAAAALREQDRAFAEFGITEETAAATLAKEIARAEAESPWRRRR
ncbi:hypothetical protein ACFC26_21925 [Kitasatospora purpeofusca]|uniref:hypothetical protein n=1 Tax=Kitasatospora purpeofusca TaxID=67352 RepID=UPI0035DE440E